MIWSREASSGRIVLVAVACQKRLLHLRWLPVQLWCSPSQWRTGNEEGHSSTNIILCSHHKSCLPYFSVLLLRFDLFTLSHFLMLETNMTDIHYWKRGCAIAFWFDIHCSPAGLLLYWGWWASALSALSLEISLMESGKWAPIQSMRVVPLWISCVSDWFNSIQTTVSYLSCYFHMQLENQQKSFSFLKSCRGCCLFVIVKREGI